MTNNLNNDYPVNHTANPSFSHHVEKKGNKESGWLKRLLVTYLVKEQQVQQPILSGRIHQLHENAHLIKNELELIKEELSNEVDADYLPLVKEVLDPLLREIGKMHPAKADESSIQKYDSWTENARKWVKIYAKKRDKEFIFQAIAKHIVEKSFDRIDRDLLFVSEYVDQHLTGMSLAPEQKHILKNKLLHDISSHYDSLASLKKSPKDLSLDAVEEWKVDLDFQRDRQLHAILHIIDNDINDTDRSI